MVVVIVVVVVACITFLPAEGNETLLKISVYILIVGSGVNRGVVNRDLHELSSSGRHAAYYLSKPEKA